MRETLNFLDYFQIDQQSHKKSGKIFIPHLRKRFKKNINKRLQT